MAENPWNIGVSYEHPVAEQLAVGIRAIAHATGLTPPDPLVIPREMFRAIAVAAYDSDRVPREEKVHLELDIDTGCRVSLEAEGYLGQWVPWKWLMQDEKRNRKRMVRR